MNPPILPEINLRGMDTGEDLRIGPVFHSGLALGLDTPGDRQYYLIEMRGESPNHGFSRLFFRGMSLFEILDLPALNLNDEGQPTSNTPFENERSLRFHQRFLSVGLESPLYHELTLPSQYEVGWTAAFTLAQVEFKGLQKPDDNVFTDYPTIEPRQFANTFQQNQAQQQAQFFAGELGSYGRLYMFYPIVPYASVRLLPGSLLDIEALTEGVEKSQPVSNVRPTANPSASPSAEPQLERGYRSGFQMGGMATIGVETYLGSRGVIGLEYTLWNWTFANLSGVNPRPDDWTQMLILKAGFLF